MNYDKDSIADYLLGNASEQDTERLDELSVADDEFADALSAAEDDLVDAYIDGELAGSSLRQFETFYLVSPLRKRKALFAEAFQQFSRRHTVEQPAAGETPQRASDPSFFSKFRSFPAWQLGFAAAATLLACIAGLLAVRNSELRHQANETAAMLNAAVQREQELLRQLNGQNSKPAEAGGELAQRSEEHRKLEPEIEKAHESKPSKSSAGENSSTTKSKAARQKPLRVATFVLAPAMRGTNKPKEISIPLGAERSVFKLEFEGGDHRAFSVAVQDQSSSRTVWRSSGLSASSAGTPFVSVSVPAGILKSGIYSIRLSGISPTGNQEIISDYTFQVVR